MDFYISQITGQQVPYEPLTAAELRQQGRPEQLRSNQSIGEEFLNQPVSTDSQLPQQVPTELLQQASQTATAQVDYEPIISVEQSQDDQLQPQIANPNATVTESRLAVNPQDVAYLAQLIASHPALAQAAGQIAAQRTAIESDSIDSSDFDKKTAKPVEPIQQSDLAADMDSDEVSNKEVIDAYTHAKQAPSQSPRVVTMVSEIMTSPVSTLPADSTVGTVWKFLQEKRFHHVPIVSSEDKLIGVISDRDFIALSAINHQGSIRSLITTNILTTRPTTDVRSAAKIMFEERIGALPVVDENENLVGILTRSDILRVLYQRAPLELWM